MNKLLTVLLLITIASGSVTSPNLRRLAEQAAGDVPAVATMEEPDKMVDESNPARAEADITDPVEIAPEEEEAITEDIMPEEEVPVSIDRSIENVHHLLMSQNIS